jgi:hypothetical protein
MKEAYNAAERCRNANIRGQFTKIYAVRAFRKRAALGRTFARPANPPCGLMSKTDLSERLTLVICLSSQFSKQFPFSPYPNQIYNPRRLVPKEGRIAIVTDAGWDAVDAAAFKRAT